MKTLRVILSCVSFCGLLALAQATELPDLGAYFQQKLELAQASVCTQPKSQSQADQTLQDINVDLISDMSFGIPSVLNFTISPELDLVFTPKSKPAPASN